MKEQSPIASAFSKRFWNLNHLLETWLITFLTFLLLRLMNSTSCFFSFRAPMKLIVYANNKILNIYRKFFGYLSPHQCVKWQGQQTQKIFVFSEGGCYVANHRICIIKRIYYAVIPVHLKHFFYFIAHITHHAELLSHC